MRNYSIIVDDITFKGYYTFEEDDEGYAPIVSVSTLEVDGVDLMLVIDPRVVQEIEAALLDDYQWNS